MTLIEVVVAFAVLLLVLLPITYLLASTVDQAASTKNQLSGLDIAEKWVEILGSAQDPPPKDGNLQVATGIEAAPVQNGTSYPTQTEGKVVYTIRAEYNWTTADGSAPNLCTSAGGAQVLALTVTVRWGAGGVNQTINDTTNLNYPAPGIPQYGFYRLQVQGDTTQSDASVPGVAWTNDQGTGRVQTIPVTIYNGPTTSGTVVATVNPDQFGCVFLELSPGQYSVKVGPTSGGPGSGTSYVENLATDGTASEPGTLTGTAVDSPVTIVAGVTSTQTTVYYDEGSNIGLTYPTSTAVEDGVTCPGVGQFVCATTGEGSTSSLGGTAVAELTSASTSAGGATWASDPTTAATRFDTVTCAGTTKCFAGGYNLVGTTSTAVIDSYAPSNAQQAYADTVTPTGVTSISQIACPAGGTACTAIGTTASGPIALATTYAAAAGDTWTQVTIPATVASLSTVTCPSATTCVAIGTSTTGTGVAVSGPVAGPWAFGTPPTGTTVSSLTQLACPSATTCMAIGTTGTSPLLLTGSGVGSTVNWTVDALPTTGITVTSLTQLTCAAATQCLETATTSTGVAILTEAPGAAATSDTLPTGITALTTLTCPSSAVCVALGSTATGAEIAYGALSTTDHWYSQASVPAGDTSATAIACVSATACAVAANGTNGADILWGTPGTATAWGSVLPGSDAASLYVFGIACTTGASGTCTAVGATPTGAMIATGTSSATWSEHSTDSGVSLTGLPTTGVPVELLNSGIINTSGSNGAWNPVPGSTVAGGTANSTALTAVYPFANTTGVVAADCLTEATNAGSVGQSTTATQPGTLLPAQPPVAPALPTTVPLGVLGLHAVNSAGAAENGATLVLTSTTSGTGCAANQYSLQTPGIDGLSRTEVPFGTYTLKITNLAGAVATTTVIVGAGTNTVGGTSTALPAIIPVVGP